MGRSHAHGLALTLALALLISPIQGAPPINVPLPEATESTIGYPTVAAALADLRTRPGVDFTMENGWLIATEEAARTIWSFAPKDYPAYPAVVKRWVTPKGTGSTIHMTAHCEASKAACDDLVRTFARMNGLPLPE